MKARLLFSSILVCFCLIAAGQPYGGTIFFGPDIITPDDSSTLESVTYTGMGMRTVFDRRVNNWININAFLYEVIWNDGLTSEAVVNPEFGDIDTGLEEAEIYGWYIGQLPTCLRVDVDEIWIHQGVELFGGGNRSILIHTGQADNYIADGILEETLVHEACHTSLDAAHAASPGWLEAQDLDGGFISDYARDFPDREDIAESYLPWLAVRYREERISQQDYDLITQAIPNRLAYFDEIDCDMYPIDIQTPTSVDEPRVYVEKIKVFPNPAATSIFLDLDVLDELEVEIFNATGVTVKNLTLNSPSFDITDLPAGLYVLTARNDGKQYRALFVKE